MPEPGPPPVGLGQLVEEDVTRFAEIGGYLEGERRRQERGSARKRGAAIRGREPTARWRWRGERRPGRRAASRGDRLDETPSGRGRPANGRGRSSPPSYRLPPRAHPASAPADGPWSSPARSPGRQSPEDEDARSGPAAPRTAAPARARSGGTAAGPSTQSRSRCYGLTGPRCSIVRRGGPVVPTGRRGTVVGSRGPGRGGGPGPGSARFLAGGALQVGRVCSRERGASRHERRVRQRRWAGGSRGDSWRPAPD